MTDNKQVIFGTGPLALWVMDELVAKGRPVTLVNRSGDVAEALPASVTVVKADATNPDAVAEICQDAAVVFHCAMPPYTDWPEKFPPLTKGIMDGVSRTHAKLIFGDNLYMYGPTTGQPIHEDLPYAATGHKGKTRAMMAKMLLDVHQAGKVRVAIARAADFYGPRVRNSVVGEMFFEAVLAGKPVNALGNVDLPHTFTYIGDYAKALVTLSERDEALGRAWHVPSAKTISIRELVSLAEKELEQPIKIRSAGRFMVSILGLFNPMIRETKEMMYIWETPYILDHSQYEAQFGAETTSHEDAIKATVAWYQQRNDC